MTNQKTFALQDFTLEVTQALAGGSSLFIWRHVGEGAIPSLRKLAESQDYVVGMFVVSPVTLPYDLGRFAARQGDQSKKGVLILTEADTAANPLRMQIAEAPKTRRLGGYGVPEETRLICIGSDHLKAMAHRDGADNLLAANYKHIAFGTYDFERAS
jgi:hypothetical protein